MTNTTLKRQVFIYIGYNIFSEAYSNDQVNCHVHSEYLAIEVVTLGHLRCIQAVPFRETYSRRFLCTECLPCHYWEQIYIKDIVFSYMLGC